jgi:alcohol dehydrogenase (cytochrome c)
MLAHRASLEIQQEKYREATVTKPFDVGTLLLRRAWKSPALAALGCAVLASISGARAADVTYERLLNPEPHNWLMNHHDYSAQRFSSLAVIDKSNVKNLKLAFAVALGGTSANEYVEATPLVDDGFLYITDVWGVVYKIDVRGGTQGRILWKMDPGQQKPDRNRGVALWGNLVVSVTGLDGRVIATDKETGKIVWDTNLLDQEGLEITAAPLALKDTIVVGASGGDNGVRDWLAALDPKTGKLLWKTFAVPAPGEPGSETWKDKSNAWQTGGGAFYVTGSYDPATNLTYWGSGNPAPRYDSAYRPGDNLFTNSTIAFDAATGKMAWYFQHTANDNRDYDSAGSQIIIDGKLAGEDRKLLVHANRNGFNYTLDRQNGQFLKAVQYAAKVTWTRASIPRPASRSTTIPPRTCRTLRFLGRAAPTCSRAPARTCTAVPISGRPPTASARGSFTSAAMKAAPTSRPIPPRT